ncbi:ABC-2 type transport system permease protein [Paenibacillus sp. JGP012]|uniref:ABC transporter permease n=1 Tax=Paenibacillus sp. JGP012 TaxID=2735914 RepID=UPI0016165F63|nr:ABC transporter permease [Paenibacillus sp. JGP012]MBB6020224.1 ABC-2 type transport system permease protein [Paenibacillus sp. JGP012]
MKSLADEWKHIRGSKWIIVIFIAPLIAAVFFGLMFSRNQLSETPVVVVDEDHSSYSRQLIEKINASQYMDITNVFANRLSPDMLLANEQAVAVIYIPEGLQQRKDKRLSSSIGIWMDNTMPSSLSGIRPAIQEIITTENMTLSLTHLAESGMDMESARNLLSPLSMAQRMLYNPTSSYVGTMVIGFVNIIILMLTTGAAGAIAPRLRQEGKLMSAGDSPFHLWIRAVPYALLCTCSSLLSYGMLKQVGHMRFEAAPYIFVVPLLLYSMALCLLAVLLGYSVRNVSKVGARMSIILYPSFLVTGIQLTPLAFPTFFQVTAWALPMNWLNRIIRGMAFRHGELGFYSLELGACILIIGLASLGIGIFLRRELRKQSSQAYAEAAV